MLESRFSFVYKKIIFIIEWTFYIIICCVYFYVLSKMSNQLESFMLAQHFDFYPEGASRSESSQYLLSRPYEKIHLKCYFTPSLYVLLLCRRYYVKMKL